MSRIHFDVTHPAHVHLFRNAIRELVDDGHRVVVSSREKELTTDLLDAYDLPHTVLSTMGTRKVELASEWIGRSVRTLRYDYRFDPDVVVSKLSPSAIAAATATGAGTVALQDHEGTNRLARLLAPFIDRISTPASFEADFGAPHRRHEGVQELAYLHPDRFTPDRDRLRAYGIEPDEPYSVLRLVSMGAYHDVGLRGISEPAQWRLVEELSGSGPVYVSAEGSIPDDLPAARTPVPPELMHDLLGEASLFVTDSNTMATEAGLLGTPTVRSGGYAATDEFSNFIALGEAGLVESIPDETAAVDRAIELASDPAAVDRWQQRREAYLADATDVTGHIVDTVLEVADE